MKLAIIGLLLLTQSLPVQATTLTDQPVALTTHVVQGVPLNQPMIATDLELPELLIEINELPEKSCRLQSTVRVIERNLTLPYHQQTLYGSNPCQSSK